MQLVAYGAQDVYLTGNPQITFFKVVYRRHTNFAVEAIEQTFNGQTNFGSTASCQITRNGDLVTKMYLHANVTTLKEYIDLALAAADAVTSPATYDLAATGFVDQTTNQIATTIVAAMAGAPTSLTDAINAAIIALPIVIGDLIPATEILVIAAINSVATNNNAGNDLIESVELQIGGTKIDKHYGHWLNIWDELTLSGDLKSARDSMVGVSPASSTVELFVPLKFFCCRNNGLALPLIALQYHDVRVQFQFASSVTGLKTTEFGATLLVEYIYLDSEERKRFAQASHEYLIEQLQFQGDKSIPTLTNVKERLNFNHPCKELIWVVINTTTCSSATYTEAQLRLNGHDRMSLQSQSYYQNVQVNQHHSTHEGIDNSMGANVYSFALKPEEHQPSGTCNFSRIDNAELIINDVAAESLLRVYAVNYNVLRIMSGMGGLAYSN